MQRRQQRGHRSSLLGLQLGTSLIQVSRQSPVSLPSAPMPPVIACWRGAEIEPVARTHFRLSDPPVLLETIPDARKTLAQFVFSRPIASEVRGEAEARKNWMNFFATDIGGCSV